MSDSDLKFFAAQLGADIPELDLHKNNPGDIEIEIDQFLYRSFQAKKDVVRIIYGGGQGIMRKSVLDFLHQHPLVEKIEEAGGSCVVKLSD